MSDIKFSTLPEIAPFPYSGTLPLNGGLQLPELISRMPRVNSIELPPIGSVMSIRPITERYNNNLSHCLYENVPEIDITAKNSMSFLFELNQFPKTEENKKLINLVRVYNELINKIIMQSVNTIYSCNNPEAAHQKLGVWIKIMDNMRRAINRFELTTNPIL